jgi:hypothetical protein
VRADCARPLTSDRLARRMDAAADALKAFGDFHSEIEEVVVRNLK